MRSNSLLILASLLPLILWSTNYTWNVDSDGNWSTNADWSPSSGHPSSSSDTATFGSITSTTRTVTIDTTSLAADSLTFNGTQPYIIAATGGNSLSIGGGASAQNIIVSGTTANTISSPLSLAASIVINQNSSNPLTISGTISGGGTLTKQGTGTLTLTGTNSFYSGTTGTILNGGTVNINNTNALGVIEGILSVTASSTLQLAATISSFDHATSISTGQTLIIDTNGFNLTHSAVISGGGILEKIGSGTLTFNGLSNSYSGGTILNGGTLNGFAGAFGSGTINVTGNGTLQCAESIIGSPLITISSGQTLTIDTNGGNSFEATNGITGSTGSLIKISSGIMILTGTNNTYGGTTTINGGTLQAENAGAFSPSSAISLANTAGVTLKLNNFLNTIPSLSGGGTTGGNVTLGSGTLTLGGDNTSTTFSGTITGTGGLTKTGTGTFQLAQGGGVNTYSGTTTVSGGILQAGAATAFSSSSAVSLPNTAGVALDLNNFSQTISSLSGGGTTGGNVTLGSGTLTLGGDNTSTTFSGTITGTGGLTKTGTGTFQLAQGGGVNTYSGTTTVSGGILQAGAATAFSSSSAVSLANTAGVALDLNNFSQTIPSLSGGGTTGGNVTLGSGGLTLGGDNTSTTFSGTITGTGGLTKTGTGTLQLAQGGGVNTYSGTTTVNGGILQAGAATAFSSSSAVSLANTAGIALDLNNFSQTIPSLSGGGTTGGNVTLGSGTLTLGASNTPTTFSGTISGTGGVTKTGTGTFTLSGTNTYSGESQIAGGTLALSGSGSVIASSISITNSSAIFDITGASSEVTIQGLSDNVGGTINLGGNKLSFGSGSSSTVASQIQGTGGSIEKRGTGTISLSGTNTYTGETVISEGTLALTDSSTLSNSSALTFPSNNGTFDISEIGAASLTFQDIVCLETGPIINLGNKELIFGGVNDTTIAATIEGAGGKLSKLGSSIVNISGSNTYTGLTTIGAGRLAVFGSILGDLEVNHGAILSGTGTIGTIGTTTVTVDGTLSPGASIGTLTILGNLILNSDSRTSIELDSISSSRIDVTGSASLNGTLVLVVDEALTMGTAYTVLTSSTSGITGIFTLDQPAGYLFSQIYTPSSLQLLLESIESTSASISTIGLTGNALSVANYLNSLADNSTFTSIVTQIADLSSSALADALNAISPSRNSLSTFVSSTTGLTYSRLLSSRMSEQRLLRRVLDKQPQLASFYEQISSGKGLWTSSDLSKFSQTPSPKTKEKWDSCSLWIDGLGEFIHQDAQNQNPAFNASIWGAFMGADYYGIEAAMVGGALGYANNQIREAEQAGKGDIDFYVASAYGMGYFGNGYIELSLSTSCNRFHNERNVVFSGYDAVAKSAHLGWQIENHIGLGYDFPLSLCLIEPFFFFDLATNFEEGYKEHNGGILDMRQKARTSALMQFQIGSNFYQNWEKEWGILILKESLSYIYQNPIRVGNITSSIVGAPNSFSVVSINRVSNLFSPAFEIFYRSKSNAFVSMTYEGQFNGKYQLNQGMIQVGYFF